MKLTPISLRSLLLAFVCLSGCSDSQSLRSFEGSAQGTTYQIRYWATQDVDQNSLAQAVAKELTAIDASMSSYRDDSVIEQFNRQTKIDAVAVDAEIVSLVRLAHTVFQASQGCYDLTVKPLFKLWGFESTQFAVPNAENIQATLEAVGMDKLTVADDTHLRKTDPALQVDLSSIGQGYSVGRMAGILDHHGVVNYLVELGGELVAKGHKPDGQPWRVAIERPLPEQRSIEKIISIDGGQTTAIMTSGTYRHFYDAQGVRYSHILDARTGFPVTHNTVSVTVLYPDASLADAWSTALLCLGTEHGLSLANKHGIPALFIEQTVSSLKESSSDPLLNLKDVRITQP